MSKARRWEKPAPAGAPAQSQSPLSTITSFVDSLNADERASHRAAYLHLMQALTGANVNVDHVEGGVKLSGVLHTITPFEGQAHAVVLKGCRVQREGSATPGANDGKTAIVDFAKVATLQNSGKLELVSRNYSTEFATDSSIKKHGDMSHLEGRNLKSVDNSWLQPGNDMSLEGKSSSGKSWDQFETNRRLFNVKDTYDENLYTKKLDLKSMTSEQIAMADRLAREIEGTVSTNIHLQEERGQAPEGDWDEEDRFSGVLKEAPAAKKAAPAPDASNPWKRGAKLTGAAVVAGTASAGASGAASPATPAGLSNSASAASISGKAPLTPPPGVTKKPAAATNAAAPAPAEAAPKKADEEKTSDKSDKTDKAADKTSEKTEKTEKVEKKAETTTAASADPATTTDKAETKPVDAATPEVKPAPVKKLNAAAAEFKPSWMTPAAAPAPAPVAVVAAAVPATPVAPSTPQQTGYVPQQQFTPSHNNNYNSPEAYNKNPHTPSFVPQQQHVPGPEGYGFDPNAMPVGMLPHQFIPGSPPMNMNMNMNMAYDPQTGNYFMPPQMPMVMPSGMDYIPQGNGLMPMPMMPMQGIQGMPMQGMQGMPYPPMPQGIQGMPMHDGSGGMYMPQNMAFPPNMGNMGMGNMGMMQQQPQPNQHMGGMYSPQQGYNNNGGMGSGQKPKFNSNNNGDIRNSANKGGRGMGGRGYNNNGMGGGRGGYGNSPQHGGMPPPSGPGGDNAPDSA